MARSSRPRNDRLRQRRRALGLTQNAVVDRMFAAAVSPGLPEPVGLDANYLSRWERGVKPTPYHSFLLCTAMDSQPAELGLAKHDMPRESACPSASRAASLPINGADPYEPFKPSIGHASADPAVNRREFLEQGVALGFGLPLTDWGAVVKFLANSSYIDQATLDGVRTLMRLHMRQWCESPPTELLPQAMSRLQLLKDG